MLFRQLFDHASSTYTYLVADEATGLAAIVDPVREQVERDVELITELGLTLLYSLETHVHADHVTGGGLLRLRLGCKTVVSDEAGPDCADIPIADGGTLDVGNIRIEARHTPGHTNGDVTYVVWSDGSPAFAFTGDTLLIRGCGRTDFQQGNASALYDSVHTKIFSLPDQTLIYPAHDYKGRTCSTVGEEKKLNPRVGSGRTKEEFLTIMANLHLAEPKQMNVAVPANMACGLVGKSGPWAPVERTRGGIPEVTAEWVRAHGSEVRLVDVRESRELRGELPALADIEHVPLGALAHAKDAWTDRTTPIVLICRSGGRSGQAAQMLEAAGFTNVASLRGGMLAYYQLAPR